MTYFYISEVLNARLYMLVVYFHSVVLVLGP